MGLAAWQQPGIQTTLGNTSTNRPQLIMSEFNSASCGGIPKISDTFAVGSLWTIDYALQMASVGYSAAYLHTRERGITYNLFAPPVGPLDGTWVTNPPYYALVATAEALQTTGGGSIVVDLNIAKSQTDLSATVAGYAVYESAGSQVEQFVLFNYANTSNSLATFALPSTAFASNGKNVTVKYLSAKSLGEQVDISWGGETLAGVGNGVLNKTSASWATPNKALDCTNGCSVDVPPTSLAVVFVRGVNDLQQNSSTTKNSGGANKNSSSGMPSAMSSPLALTWLSYGLYLILFTLL